MKTVIVAAIAAAVLVLSGCASGDAAEVELLAAPTPEPAPSEPAAADRGGGPTADLPPRPEELGPDGDLLPGTPKYREREAARAEFEAFKLRQTAAAQAIAPEVDAFARQDRRVADLLADATYDLASAVPVGGSQDELSGGSLTYALPVPRDFRYVYADFDGSRAEDIVAVAHYIGARQVTVVVNLRDDRFLGLRFDDHADVTTYDAQGHVLISSVEPDEHAD